MSSEWAFRRSLSLGAGADFSAHAPPSPHQPSLSTANYEMKEVLGQLLCVIFFRGSPGLNENGNGKNVSLPQDSPLVLSLSSVTLLMLQEPNGL